MDLTAGVQTYEVRSFNSNRLYIVRQNQAGDWSCSCPHWQYRLAPTGGHCKHIQQLMDERAADGHGGEVPGAGAADLGAARRRPADHLSFTS